MLPRTAAELHIGDHILTKPGPNQILYRVISENPKRGRVTVEYVTRGYGGRTEMIYRQQWSNGDVKAAFYNLGWSMGFPPGVRYPEGI